MSTMDSNPSDHAQHAVKDPDFDGLESDGNPYPGLSARIHGAADAIPAGKITSQAHYALAVSNAITLRDSVLKWMPTRCTFRPGRRYLSA